MAEILHKRTCVQNFIKIDRSVGLYHTHRHTQTKNFIFSFYYFIFIWSWRISTIKSVPVKNMYLRVFKMLHTGGVLKIQRVGDLPKSLVLGVWHDIHSPFRIAENNRKLAQLTLPMYYILQNLHSVRLIYTWFKPRTH